MLGDTGKESNQAIDIYFYWVQHHFLVYINLVQHTCTPFNHLACINVFSIFITLFTGIVLSLNHIYSVLKRHWMCMYVCVCVYCRYFSLLLMIWNLFGQLFTENFCFFPFEHINNSFAILLYTYYSRYSMNFFFITSYWERERILNWERQGKRERILFILCWINFLSTKFVVCIHWIWYLAAWHNSMFCCLSLEKFEYAQIESTHSDKKNIWLKSEEGTKVLD